MKPLQDINVLSFTHAASGPYAGRLLAEWGANVVKVEPPAGAVERNAIKHDHYLSNRGKQSLAVDLKSEEGRQIIYDMVESDFNVVLENYRPNVMPDLGLGYDDLKERNDRLIYCSLSGFGSAGPYKDRPALDPIVQAMSGLMQMTGEPDRPPSRVGASILDLGTATNAVVAILLAIIHRMQTGEGQFVETSLFDTAFGWAGIWAVFYSLEGSVPQRMGDSIETYAPNGLYETRDELVYISGLGDSGWARICEALGLEELIDDPRFADPEARRENRDELDELLERATSQLTSDELVDLMLEYDIPAAKLKEIPEVMEDEHLEYRDMILNAETEDGEDVVVPGVPIKLESADPENPDRPAELGSNSIEILESLDYNDERIRDLIEREVILGE
jgi:crotonobetainyl-CoA:carnitine CoA-transferase CaiB-like acyl-CoA transferase